MTLEEGARRAALAAYGRRVDELTNAVRRKRDSHGPEARALRVMLRAYTAETVDPAGHRPATRYGD